MHKIEPKFTRLKDLRKRRSLKQETVADLAGTSQAQLSKIEKGLQQPSASLFLSIVGAISISITDFMANLESLLDIQTTPANSKNTFTHVKCFDDAIELAQDYSMKSNWHWTHIYLALADSYSSNPVESARVRMGYGIAFRDRGHFDFALRYFNEAARILGPKGDQFTHDKLTVNVADLFCYRNLPNLAGPLVGDANSRLTLDTKEGCIGRLVQGRVDILFGNLSSALTVLGVAQNGFSQLKEWKWAGWCEVWMADAESKSPDAKTRADGIVRFDNLMEQFGPSSHPQDIDVFGWACLKKALALNDANALGEAREFAEIHDKLIIVRIAQGNPIS